MPTDLRSIKRLDQLVAYLRDELDWPIDSDDIEDISFTYEPDELGLDAAHAARIHQIKQIRPLDSAQPWGIFWVSFEKKHLPVVVLRRILASLVVKSRQSANSADRPRWKMNDLLFVSAYGDESTDQREIAFAHFSQNDGDLPTLRVLGWDGADTRLKLDHVAHTLADKLRWPSNPSDAHAWRQQWSAAFRHRLGHIVKTSDTLAEVLADLARRIRDSASKLLGAESDRGPLTKLFKAFQAALIHDLTQETFADAYAQTITYGLFTAAINRTEMSAGTAGTFVKADDIAIMARVTSPFLKEMLETFLTVGGRKNGVDFDELGIQDVVELLRGEETDLPAILRDFGNRTRGEDPVIHFYEHFLSAYNKQLKVQRGIFYTPQPAVSYIVRSVHELLQTEFGLEDGLASTVTWGEMLKRHPGLKLPPLSDEPGDTRTISADEPFVQILDPATGTATFLVEAVDVIYRTLAAKWKKQGHRDLEFSKLWNEYVPKHLLPRLHGYELLAAPYAIAHLKLGLKLTETGYRFGSDERARIYLTNALEPKVNQLPQIGFEPLAHEAQAVNEIKWYKRFTVVIGNPPYSGQSSNQGDWALALARTYYTVDGRPLGEANPKWLLDDYVKFIRFGQWQIEVSGCGILAFITNHGYLDNPTFRGMRQSLITTFGDVCLLDLHGNSKKKERCPDGSKDENIFDIQQGVAVGIFAKHPASSTTRARHASLWGGQAAKYKVLRESKASSTEWSQLSPTTPHYLLVPQDIGLTTEYAGGWKITDIMPVNSTGIATARDALTIHWSKDDVWKTVTDFVKTPPEAARHKYDLGDDARDWKVALAQKDLSNTGPAEENIIPVVYKPFDTRYTYFTGKSRGFHCMPRAEVMNHVLGGPNICLAFARAVSSSQLFRHVFSTKHPMLVRAFPDASCVAYLSPLYLYSKSRPHDLFDVATPPIGSPGRRQSNLSPKLLADLSRRLGIVCLPEGRGDCRSTFGPEDVFYNLYAVLHSPAYSARYAEFLKTDFPRVPLTSHLELFGALASLGGELVALHLLESPKLDHPITEYLGGRAPEVEKVFWSKNTAWLDKAQTTGFKGVREDVWHFHVAGYNVCEKWLKDRKGRQLSADDRAHYQKIIVALSETIRIMKEIDQVIDKHGGWPLK